MFVLKCDCCGKPAPDWPAPILMGIERWGEFTLNGEYDGRKYTARVLLCGQRDSMEAGCARAMEHYIEHGGPPPFVQTFKGGQTREPEWVV